MTSSSMEPLAHNDSELSTVLALLAELCPDGGCVAIGGSRDESSRATAYAVADAWRAADGDVLTVLDWPDRAASWLRQARRFTSPAPDAWVVTGRPDGWLSMGRRLADSTDWQPTRTVATASLADPALAADDAFTGLRGAHLDGGTWRIHHRRIVTFPPPGDRAGRKPDRYTCTHLDGRRIDE